MPSNHPNRSPVPTEGSNPGPGQISAAREAAGLTPTQAARLVLSTTTSWSHWERGVRMPPGVWLLFRARVAVRAGNVDEAVGLLGAPQ